MPIFESACTNQNCPNYDLAFEWLGRPDDPEPFCPECGSESQRMVSQFGIVFTGVMSASKYNTNTPGGDPKGRHMDGHWVTRVRSSKSGHSEQQFISTFEEQARYCKEEGLVNPRDLDTAKVEARPNGKWKGDV